MTKGGRLDPEDGLLFVVRVYNPKVDAATKTVRLSRTVKIKPKGAPSMDVPQPADQPVAVPDSKEGRTSCRSTWPRRSSRRTWAST